MIGVRQLVVAAIFFCDFANSVGPNPPGGGTSSASVPSNADAGMHSETQQVLATRTSASADKPSSSSASAAAAEASSSLLPQNAGSHSPTHHIGDGETSSASNSWRIWEYECNDLPAKCPHCKTRMGNMLKYNKDARNLRCNLCKMFWWHKATHPNVGPILPERWSKYIKPTNSIFHDEPNLFNALQTSQFKNILWPERMVNLISFTKRVGFAIFREGITPDLSSLPKGGYFTMTILTKVGKRKDYYNDMKKLKELSKSLLRHFFGIHNGDGLEAGLEVRAAVCGIFALAEIDIKDENIAEYYENSEVWPARFRFQVWLRDWDGKKDVVAADLAKWTAAKAPTKEAKLTELNTSEYGFDELNFYEMSDIRA